jgi:hypothetical protein
MSKYSGFSFLNRGNSVNRTANAFKENSDKRIKFYLDLCTQKEVPPQNYTKMTNEELSAEIDRLYGLRSKAQLDLIKQKITQLQELGVQINLPKPEVMNNLTGGKGGTASSLINQLIEIENEHNSKLPPLDVQIKKLKDMFLVLEVPYEDYGIKRKVPYEEMGDGYWRWVTPEEFDAQCKELLTKSEAQSLIERFYYSTYAEWRKTRLSQRKADMIRTLEGYLFDKPNSDWYLDLCGNLVERHDFTRRKTLKEQYIPNNFTPLDEFQLQMFSDETADKYIEMLKEENKRSFGYTFQQSDDSKTFEKLRKVKEADLNNERFRIFQEIMFSLEAKAGYDDEDLHNAAVSLFTDEDLRTSDMLKDYADKIRGFMFNLLDTGAITFGELIEMCSNSDIAMNLLLNR